MKFTLRLFITSILLAPLGTSAQQQQGSENLIIITTDGFRWQELFGGLDTVLAKDRTFNQDGEDYLFKKYGDRDPVRSRSRIMPFFWNTLAPKGQVYGNRKYGSKVNVSNMTNISFPGYSELLTGYVDERIFSNAFSVNPNENVLQFFSSQRRYHGKVAAFGGWAAFPYILNREKSTFPIFAAYDSVGDRRRTAHEALINSMMQKSYKPFGPTVSMDVFTHHAALDYLKTRRPKILYIAYAETDEWAHAGKYKDYIDAANHLDSFLEQIWNWVQSTPEYRNKTTLFITTDHGRGDQLKEKWVSHGSGLPESGEIWFAAVGPGIAAKGEIRTEGQIYQKQFAQTLAAMLRLRFQPGHQVGEPVRELGLTAGNIR